MLFDFCIFIMHPRQRRREYEHIQKITSIKSNCLAYRWKEGEKVIPKVFFSISHFALDPFSIRFLIPTFFYFRMKFSKTTNICYGSNQVLACVLGFCGDLDLGLGVGTGIYMM